MGGRTGIHPAQAVTHKSQLRGSPVGWQFLPLYTANDPLTRNHEVGTSGPTAAARDTHWWPSFPLDLGRARTTAPCNSLRVGPQNMLYLPAAGTQWAMYVQILGHTES